MLNKQKTKSYIVKRFKKTSNGKISYFSSGKRHNLTSRTSKSLRFSGRKSILQNRKSIKKISSFL